MATARKNVVAKPTPSKGRVGLKPAAKKGNGRRAVESEDEDAGYPEAASSYFANVSEKNGLKFVSSGSAVMDAALGGGWVLGRVANIVGDRSAGKTLLAIEACANFDQLYPNGKIRYAESEAAFDEKYAEALGLPKGKVDFTKADESLLTIEDWYKDILKVMKENKGRPILYILDSLDALSDDAESKREIDDGSYGANKAKKLGEMFRRIVQQMEEQEVLLIVVSQLRDKIGVTFGEKQTRSGGRALDFYASHIVWLTEIGKLKRTIDKVERIVGVNVKARVKKNKVGLPFRECLYPILFGYGVDDLTANVEWLIEAGCDHRLEELTLSKAGYKVRLLNLRNKGGQPVRDLRNQLKAVVFEEWRRIEEGFLPKTSKY